MTARWALVMIPDYVRANPHSIRSLLSMLLTTKDCLPLLRMLVHLYQANPASTWPKNLAPVVRVSAPVGTIQTGP